MESREFFMNFHLKECVVGNHNLLRLIVTRGIADVVCFILRFLRHCGLCAEMDVIN